MRPRHRPYCTRSNAPQTFCVLTETFPEAKLLTATRALEDEEEEEGDAKPGRPAQRRRTRGGSACPAGSLPTALLQRSPAPASRNKLYVLLRPHSLPPTQDRTSPRPPPPNSTRDPENHPSLPATTTKSHSDRRG
ncbi:uncharacterized protein LOC108592197 [Callithrix jacchus]|uniref:uncharacterized protein LOC108592197 n=1 Tax=Callithrix jacchus TaxID=9483 RepID=UPI0001D36D20|nr:uncharacterized protein LOC108592197 [Callithrix jacchus]